MVLKSNNQTQNLKVSLPKTKPRVVILIFVSE